MSESKKTTTIRCPGCDKFVDEAFYPQHIESGHQLHVIEIKGLGPQLIVGPRTIPMIDMPYLGRVRRDGFLAWSLFMLILGTLLAAYSWRII
jgi:hypothetical protein